MKTLRRRLFGSHLLVMAVALAVMLAGVLVVVAFYEIAGLRFGGRHGDDNGPLGLFFGLGAAALASGIVSWRVAQRIAAPLEEVAAAARQLASGRYDVRLPGADTYELDRLATDVNHLAAELETTEARRLRLIGDVAHELRNPLATVEGTMEALLDGVVEGDDATFARIGREAARLRRLADDLSSLSAAGELGPLATEQLDVRDLVTHVVDQLEPQATAKGLDLALAPGPPVIVPGDRDRLTQVLMNVIGNAVQYTDEGRIDVQIDELRLDASTDGVTTRHVIIEVRDTGRGLRPEDTTRVFERFYRADDSFADGTGVGLAIAQLVVAAHGGSLTAASRGLGHGSTFRIELPRG